MRFIHSPRIISQAQVRPENEEKIPEKVPYTDGTSRNNQEGGKRSWYLLVIGVFMALLTLVLYFNFKNKELEIPKTQEQKPVDLPLENQEKPLEKQAEIPQKSLKNTVKK